MLSGRKVHTHSYSSNDDNYILAYGNRNLYLISILKDYNKMKLSIDKNTSPLQINAENVEKFKYNSATGTATVVLKDKKGKFSVTPSLEFFDKPDTERKKEFKEILKDFSKEF